MKKVICEKYKECQLHCGHAIPHNFRLTCKEICPFRNNFCVDFFCVDFITLERKLKLQKLNEI